MAGKAVEERVLSKSRLDVANAERAELQLMSVHLSQFSERLLYC